MRGRWTKQLDFTVPDARNERVDYLWFVGDFASFHERVTPASAQLARILHGAGVSFGNLYDGERNAGNDVRRVGEEGLFELLAEHNVATLQEANFDAIITADPHSLNTLRNEYPGFGIEVPVYHHSEILAELVAHGRLVAHAPVSARVTYHDPCYLARYNGIMEAPRRVIAATGATLIEMPRRGLNAFCCGAGGGRIWMSEQPTPGQRPSEQRIGEAQSLGDLDYFIVSCPKDLVMYTDAALTVGADFQVIELAGLVERMLSPRDQPPLGAATEHTGALTTDPQGATR